MNGSLAEAREGRNEIASGSSAELHGGRSLRLSGEADIDDPLAGDFVGAEEKRLAEEFGAVGKPKTFGVSPAALFDNLRNDRQPVRGIEKAFEAHRFIGFVREPLLDFQLALI